MLIYDLNIQYLSCFSLILPISVQIIPRTNVKENAERIEKDLWKRQLQITFSLTADGGNMDLRTN